MYRAVLSEHIKKTEALLEKNGFEVTVSEDIFSVGDEYDVAVIGEAVLEADLIRQKIDKIPIPVAVMFEREKREEYMKVASVADECIFLPANEKEILARIILAIEKSKERNYIEVGGLRIDLRNQKVFYDGNEVVLTKNEYDVITLLADNKHRIIKREDIMKYIWNSRPEEKRNILDVYISYIRNKIDKKYKVRLIRTIKGVGYCLSDKV